jgi:kynurenine formamidase
LVPGFSKDAVSWLLDERGIFGLGTECSDIELPWKTKQAVKHLLALSNKYSVVQVKYQCECVREKSP